VADGAVTLEALAAAGVTVTAGPTDHRPVAPTVGYRIEHEGRVVVLAGDTVPCDGLDQLLGAEGLALAQLVPGDDGDGDGNVLQTLFTTLGRDDDFLDLGIFGGCGGADNAEDGARGGQEKGRKAACTLGA
jgi:hypothetical protein